MKQSTYSAAFLLALATAGEIRIAHAEEQAASNASPARSSAVLEETIVTATRRLTDAQTTAASLTAVDSNWLSDRSVQSIEQIADFTPGLQIATYQGDTSIFIRGIGTPVIIGGNDSSTAAYLDGVYLSRAAAIGPAFFDVDRVEVLRGPQGTLYGRNATGGAVNIITKGPTEEFSGDARLILGNYDRMQFSGAVSGALTDRVRARAAVQYEHRDGYTEVGLERGDLPPSQPRHSFDAEDKEDFSVRLKLEADLSETAMLTITGDYYRADDRANVFHYASAGYGDELGPGWYDTREGSQTLAYFAVKNSGEVAEAESRDYLSAAPFYNETEVWGITGQLDWELGEYDLQVIANYKDTNPDFQNSFDASELWLSYYRRAEDHQQHSIDFQVSSPQGGRFTWVAGGGYFSEENDITNNVYGDFWEPILTQGLLDLQAAGVIPEFPVSIPETTLCCELHLNGASETEAFAFYFDSSYQLTDTVSLIAGIRYSEEERDGFQHFDLEFLPATPGGEQVRFAPVAALFPNAISDSREGVQPDPFGFVVAPVEGPTTFDDYTPKAGIEWAASDEIFVYGTIQKGFKSGGYNIGSSQRTPFEPEEVWSYEVGVKADLLENRLRVNTAAFFYDYKNLQAQDSIGNQPIIRNVGKAEVKGAEVEFIALLSESFQLDGSLTYVSAEFTEGELTEPLRPAPPSEPAGSVVRDLDGLQLPRAPEWKLNIGGQYTHLLDNGGEMNLRLDYGWQDKIYFTVFNIDAASQDSYGLLKARASYTAADGGYTVAVFGDNLTDEEYFGNQILTGTVYGAEFVGPMGSPRTYGVEFSVNF